MEKMELVCNVLLMDAHLSHGCVSSYRNNGGLLHLLWLFRPMTMFLAIFLASVMVKEEPLEYFQHLLHKLLSFDRTSFLI